MLQQNQANRSRGQLGNTHRFQRCPKLSGTCPLVHAFCSKLRRHCTTTLQYAQEGHAVRMVVSHQNCFPNSENPADFCFGTLKLKLLGLTSLERSIARQCLRILWLKDGDAYTQFIHAHVSHRGCKNFITKLTVGDSLVMHCPISPSSSWSKLMPTTRGLVLYCNKMVTRWPS